MVREPPLDLLLFIAGEPGSEVGSMQNVQSSLGLRLLSVAAPIGRWTGRGDYGPKESEYQHPPLTEIRPWHIPAPQIQCADLVFARADKLRKVVGVVDVNRPQGHDALVARWVGPDDVLPVLVRPDGQSLRGVESFTPARLRSFIGPT